MCRGLRPCSGPLAWALGTPRHRSISLNQAGRLVGLLPPGGDGSHHTGSAAVSLGCQ